VCDLNLKTSVNNYRCLHEKKSDLCVGINTTFTYYFVSLSETFKFSCFVIFLCF
jgi:hypothetical protein